MRKVAIIVVVVCVIVVLALAVIPQFIDVNSYRGRIQTELQQRLGRQVSLGDMHLSLLPPTLKVKDVVIGEDPNFGAGPFAKAGELDVRVSLLPLLRKDVEIQSLRLLGPEIELIRNPHGDWNYASLGQSSSLPAAAASQPPLPGQSANVPQPPVPQPSKPNAGTPDANSKQTAPQLSLAHLAIESGRVRLIDRQKGTQNTYENIDLAVNGFQPGKAFDIDGSVQIAGKGSQRIQVKGTAGPMINGSAIIPFNGTVDLKQISLSDLRQVANIPALDGYNGVLSGSLKANTQNNVLNSEGSLKIDDPQIKTTKLGYPISVDYKISDDLDGGVIRIEGGTIHLGQTPISIAGSLNTTPNPPQLDMRVKTQGASISEMARLAAAAGVAFNAGSTIKGTLNADVAARGATSNPALNGNLKADGLEISGGQIKQAVTVPQVELSLTPTAIASNQFTARTGSTQLSGQFTLKNYTSASPDVQATLQTNNANVGELLSMANAYGISGVEGMSGSGVISLNLSAAGPAKNASAMVFNGNGSIQNASLNMPTLTKPLNVKNANIRFSQNSMLLDNVAASLDQTNARGNMSIQNFAAPRIQFALSMDKLDLAALQNIVKEPATEPVKRTSLEIVPRAEAAPHTQPEPSMLAKATGNGAISVGTLTYDALVMSDVKSNVTLDHGIIRLSPLTSTVYGGQETGEITLDTRQTPAAVTVNTKLQRVDANNLISSMTSLKQTIYGLLAANANTSFRAESGSNFAKSLNGNLSLDLSNGRIAGVDMLNQLSAIGKFLNAGSASGGGQPFTAITKLTGSFNVVNGVAQTNNLRAVIPGANLAANGLVNLATNAINMHVTAVLAKDFSQKVGGTGIGGFMQTALANKNGELVMPVLVTGTLDRLQFAPDVQQVAQMKLQNLVPSFSNPGNMTSGILGSVLGGNKGQAGSGGLGGVLGAIAGQQQQGRQKQGSANQKQAVPANPVGDLLNQVMGGKKKK